MWKPDENFYIRIHIIGSLTTLACCVSIFFIGMVPSFFPGIYRILVDDRVGIVLPYLLFIAVGESVFSIWYFKFRKKE